MRIPVFSARFPEIFERETELPEWNPLRADRIRGFGELILCLFDMYSVLLTIPNVSIELFCTVAGKWLTLFGSMEKKGDRVSSASIVAHQRAVEGQHGSRTTWHIEVMMLLIALRFPPW